MRKLRSVAAPLLAALLAAPALAEGLDLSAVAARVDAALADGTTPPKSRRRYAALQSLLRRPDVDGLADDFAKIERVARQARGALSDDAALGEATTAALVTGLDALDDEEAAVTVAALDLESAAARRQVERRVHAGRSLEARARSQSVAGRPDRACASGRLAAAAFQAAASLVDRRLRQQQAEPPSWRVVLDGLDAALLSVHVSDAPAAPVFVVGANDALGPTFLRGGPEGFVRIPVTGTADLWWVDGVPGDGVWACGEGGTAVTYDPATGAVTDRSVAAETGILYGVWGSGAADVWAVGEDPDAGGPLPAAFHWDGAAWSPASLPEDASGMTLYKVWGGAADDVWTCGRGGLLLHFDGTAWSAVASGTPSSLLTVHGTDPAVAVGIAPVITERDATGAWTPVQVPAGTESLNGVRVGADGDAWAVGYFRTVLRRTPRGWARETRLPATKGRDYHSVAIDPASGVWIAGGVLTSMGEGTLLHRGTRAFASTIVPQAMLAARVRPLLSQSCAETACHAPPYLSEGLDLGTADGLRARLAGVPSRQSPLPLVVPGRPSASYLLRKLEGTQAAAGGRGARMPSGREMAQDDVDAVRAWILEGAPGE